MISVNEVKFILLEMKNFKSHQDLTVNFGEITRITGDNAQGKSSILEAISWLLYNTDVLGSKLDPSPITYETEETMVSLLLYVQDKQLLLGRGLKKGKAQYYINEVPSKATEFNEVVSQLFDKELFFSQFNPNYFFTLNRNDQRGMLLKYVSAPANKEVLKSMPETQANRLGELLKKHSLDDIEKIHKDNKNKKDKAHIAAESRTKTLFEQMEKIKPENGLPLESIKVELAHIDMQVREKEKILDEAWEKNQEFNKVKGQILNHTDQIEISKEKWPTLKNEPIEEHCRTCKQSLSKDAVNEVKADHERRMSEYKSQHSSLLNERKQLQEKIASIEFIETNKLKEEISQIDLQGTPLREALRNYKQYEQMEAQAKEAEEQEKEILQSLNDSIFVLDSIKAFKAKEAEIQVEIVQSLFDHISIKLFEELKNGEIKPTFEVEMDGKEYKRLSLSEGIRAGLELREVLIKQSEIIVPVFIDNAESITKFKQPSGQLIMAQVVAGEELKISND